MIKTEKIITLKKENSFDLSIFILEQKLKRAQSNTDQVIKEIKNGR